MGWILLITFAKKYFRFVIISKRPQIWKDLLDIEFKQILRHLEQRHLKRRHYILATTTNHKKASMTFKTFNISPPHFAAWNKYILTWSDCLRATFFHKHIKLNLVLKPLKFKHVWYKEKILRRIFIFYILTSFFCSSFCTCSADSWQWRPWQSWWGWYCYDYDYNDSWQSINDDMTVTKMMTMIPLNRGQSLTGVPAW